MTGRRGRRTRRDSLATAALHGLHIAVLVVDGRDRVVLSNPAARAMGLLRGDEQLALNELRVLAQQTRGSGSAHQADVRLLHGWLPREPGAVHARATPIGWHGHVALLVEDVTQARRIEDMRRDFVANISHELKTPIGALSLLSEAMIEASDDTAAIRQFSARMHHESTRLARLVTELIELSRLESSEPLAEPPPVTVTAIVGEAVDRTRLAAAASGITLKTDVDPNVQVRGHRDQLVTALANLIDNAIAYSPAGTHVRIHAWHQSDGAEQSAKIAVTDQGIGIAEHELDRVFERFYRADPARSRATGGTGLGLSIVKHTAANHRGRVEVTSRLAHGSTFTLTLPTAGHPQPARSPMHPSPAPSREGANEPARFPAGSAEMNAG